jgi:hypothetical protein
MALTDYERERANNIARNHARMKELDLVPQAIVPSRAATRAAPRRAAPRAPQAPIERVQRSMRSSATHWQTAETQDASSSGSEDHDGRRKRKRTAPAGPLQRAHHLLQPDGATDDGVAPRIGGRGGDVGNGLKRAQWNKREPDEAAGEIARPLKTSQLFADLVRGERVSLDCSLADLMRPPNPADDDDESNAVARGAVLTAGAVITVAIPGKGDVASATLQADGTLVGAAGGPGASVEFATLNTFVRESVKAVTATKFNPWLHSFVGGVVADALRELWLRAKYMREN